MVNRVILLGRLGQNPELRETREGTPVANFSLATNETWTDKAGEKQERTEWHRVVAWGKLGELCAQYLTKGRQAYVEGRLVTRQWESADGQKHSAVEVVASSVVFVGGHPGGPREPRDENPFGGDDWGENPFGG
jgi:single-strand DNA-binding protein